MANDLRKLWFDCDPTKPISFPRLVTGGGLQCIKCEEHFVRVGRSLFHPNSPALEKATQEQQEM